MRILIRFEHLRNGVSTALISYVRRLALKTLGINFENKIDLKYVATGFYTSEVLSSVVVSEVERCSFQTKLGNYDHLFDQREYIKISNVLVNTESNLIYIKNQDYYRYLIESSEWSPESILLNNKKPRGKNFLSIDKARMGLPNTSFYHWVSEDLPTFLLNESKSVALQYKKSFNNISQVINFLNIETTQVPKWVHVKELEFVSKKPDLGKLHPKLARTLQNFGRMITGNTQQSDNIFYISRKFSRRSLKDEEIIESELTKLNVKVVYAEKLTFFEQIKLFSTAKTIIGVQGAGLVHSVWGNNCNVIEINNNKELNRCFEWQTNLLNGTFQSISLAENMRHKEIIDRISDAIHSI